MGSLEWREVVWGKAPDSANTARSQKSSFLFPVVLDIVG